MQKLKSLTFILLLGLAAASLVPGGAAKASILFEYNGTCVINCAHISLADGAAVSGFIEFDSTKFAQGEKNPSTHAMPYRSYCPMLAERR